MKLLEQLSVTERSRRVVLVLVTVLAMGAGVIARPLLHLAWAARQDHPPVSLRLPAGQVADASQLNPTSLQVIAVAADMSAAEQQLRQILRTARSQGKKVTIAGSRHTMGGQTLYPGSFSLNMRPLKAMQFDVKRQVLRVQAGATWAEVIPYLNQQGYAVAVMQSNNDFTVGGTLSANAHGWRHNHRPFASTVESLRLMLANGEIVTCSRQQNSELFALVLGGYGLFGIVLEVNLKVVPNQLYEASRQVIPARDYITSYRQQVTSDVGMAYGRLSIAPGRLLEEAILTTYRPVPTPEGILPLPPPAAPGLARTVFVGSIGNDYGKELRWLLEKNLGGEAGERASRNQIMNRPAQLFELNQPNATEILHEYFVPPDRLEAFLVRCRQILPKHSVELLNVTVRNVEPDPDSFLAYARQEVFGLVMLFRQPRTLIAEAQMQALSRALIDAVLAEGGTYYLPYRLHASQSQLSRAYPRIQEFWARKRSYDPEEIFQNQLYVQYGTEHQPILTN
jgi:FAD/FMN-containing dehydrogenase